MLLLLLLLPVMTLGMFAAETEEKTRVVSVTPRDEAMEVGHDDVVQIHFSTGLKLRTISAETTRLLDTRERPVPTHLGFDLEGDVVSLRAQGRLRAETKYVLEVDDGLIDKEGDSIEPFRSSFTTGTQSRDVAPIDGFQFSKTKIDEEHGPTAIAIGPDGNAYAATCEGVLYRLQLDAVPASNLYLTILKQLGCPVESFKESNGTLSEVLA